LASICMLRTELSSLIMLGNLAFLFFAVGSHSLDPQSSVGLTDYDAGINLPSTQGSSGTGAFMPGVYNFSYTPAEVAALRGYGFTSIRLPVNVISANDAGVMSKLKSYVDAIGGRGIICMFGTAIDEGDNHGSGIVDNVTATSQAWAQVHKVFASFPEVKYEIFNEPAGYTSATEYYNTMLFIIQAADLPAHKCILAGTSWESGIQEVASLGWQGYLGYHIYPNWLPDGQRTQEQYSNLVQHQLSGLSSRVFITEFGANLNRPNHKYDEYDPSGTGGGDVNCLRGLNDAVIALRQQGLGIKGAFHWHGWHNGDSFDFFEPSNANGSAGVSRIIKDAYKDATEGILV